MKIFNNDQCLLEWKSIYRLKRTDIFLASLGNITIAILMLSFLKEALAAAELQ